jgi:cap2 methyltransferase
MGPHRRPARPPHPHCRQLDPPVFASRFCDVLDHGAHPRMKYAPRDIRHSTLHRGQRKLLMSEIGAFVRLDPSREFTVVYAGAAPGIHIPLLAELFPRLAFHLYDPKPFAIRETERIRIVNDLFTDRTAEGYSSSSSSVVFVCDIRRTNEEKMVWEDMLAQKRWHEIMRPALTSLKFRLPWPGCGVADESNRVTYLDGEIHLPVWGPCNTTESRLVIDRGRCGERTYDCLAYEEEMCHFNRVVRPSVHGWQTSRADFLDGCYDCAAESALIERYSRLYRHTELTTGRISRELGRSIRSV